ncbi:MAG: DNA translocase FtsK 4TM domain-containing protein, partial [Phototrophicaceae bacterium]
MGTYDDDFYDDDDDLKYTEDDDLDDDESVSSSASVNPFITGGARTASDRYGSNRPAGGKPIGSGTGRPETSARDPKDAAADRARFFGGGGSGSSSSGGSSSGGSGLGNRLSGGMSGGMSRTPTPPPRPGDPGSRPGSGLPGSSPSSRPDSSKPDKKGGDSGGGMLGKFGNMLPGKKKNDDAPPGRPAPPKPSAGSGGGLKDKLGGFMPGKGKKDSGGDSSGGRFSAPKPGGSNAGDSGGGGMLGKFGGMLPGRKKKDDDKPKPAPGGGPGGARPSPYSSGSSRPGYGQSAAPAADSKPKRGNPLAGFKNRLFGGGDDKKPPKTSKTRAHQERTPHMTDEGLSLDQKLDLLGVGLVFGALVLFFSSLSHEQGALTGTVNTFFSQIFGWGAIGVPIAMAAAGVWLIVRHFGDEAPVIDPVRLAGVTMGYVGLLMVFMFIETWSDFYRTATQSDFHLYVAISVREGRGGGWVGAELYALLVTNFGEISAFVFVFGWLIVSIMLMTRTSAAELAVFVISVWRSLRIALQHRAQRSAAIAAEKRAALTAQQEQLRISGPDSPELPAGQQRALPPGEPPIEQRDITIRMGGQMIEAGAAAESDLQPAAAHHAGAQAVPSQPPKAGGGRLGGLTSRLKGAIPAALPFATKGGGRNGATDDDIEADDSASESAASAPAQAEASDKKPLSLGSLLKSRSESSGLAANRDETPLSTGRHTAAFIADDDDEFDDDSYFDDDEDDDLPPHAARPFQPPKPTPAARSAPSRPPFVIDDDDDDDLRDDDSPALDDRIEHKPAASGGSL